MPRERLARLPAAITLPRRDRILILGKSPLGEQIASELASRPGRGTVVGVVDERNSPVDEADDRLPPRDVAHLDAVIEDLRPNHIVVALTERRNQTPVMQALLSCAFARGITIENAADCYERLTGKLALESWTPMSVVFSGKLRPSRLQRTIARGVSLTLSLVALVLVLPLFLIIALAIRLDSPGPVLFVQQRVGAYGRPFRLLKFRSMHNGLRRSEWEHDNRDQVTRVGKWLRLFRLDELPQLLNIIRGEMNLVGPRPHPMSNLELFTLVARNLNELTGAAISCYALRTSVPPGLTGWAQVRYQYANNLEEEIEKLRYDLYYIKHMSWWLDLRILLETVKVICGNGLALFRPAAKPVADIPVVPILRPAPQARPVAARATRPSGAVFSHTRQA